ncbi:MAG: hypothetical protein IJO95_00225 [Clostridia bacterium]|nr:hypothetical protein [Clostridia bacterium]
MNEKDYLEEYVPVRLFKDNEKYSDDVFVAVNGEGCLIRRGETVMIKRKFAEVLEQSDRQDLYAAGLMAVAEDSED